ncbi:N-acyl-D-amino-acid deacylase family protein [Vineibacter terrae]|uniref:N-acyl-D-amino-acid deacylase family protein n=1 Tax=Vineibacter terrae TaxID=2586908 RepID=UPI002E33F012|nr:amidohydrolase family protein [Vineibacter terrae]HEX2890403.1 amidohydrolase family protein [Vineibacter terrae]
MYDLVIRGGSVIDGSGAPARTADVAVTDGRIAAVGDRLGPARREVDADGLLVTPGFVDIHTHYDGQATWDPYLTPSSWHGVTTAVFGNCGVGFAPVRPGTTDYLINLMEGVEDIPGTVLSEGVPFNWESFPQYMDALAAMPRAIDVGAQVPHAALRFYVMGERGADHAQTPTGEELDRMARLLEESLLAGALGFTTSRTTKHRARDGRLTPSLSAREPELFALARAMNRAGRGVLEVNSDFGPGEFEALQAAAEIARRPLSCLLVQVNNAPDLWRQTLDQIRAARAAGLDANAQVGCRPIGVLLGLDTTVNPFSTHPAWASLRQLTAAERYQRLLHDADLRQRLVAPAPEGTASIFAAQLSKAYPLTGAGLDYEPEASRSVAALAAARGVDPRALALELMMADGGTGLLLHPFENYCGGNLDVVHAMLTDDATVLGVADGGAHVGVICDAGAPTYLLTHWARDRTRGPRLPLEFLVRKQTREGALAYGMADRGLLAPGLKADINVIDFDRLRLRAPQVVYDLPAGGKRLVQKAEGYRHIFVSGVETLQADRHTGELPGRLVRSS